MGATADFQRLQYAFAAHLRDPERAPIPAGIEPRRIKVYADLFYANIDGLLAGNFPVIRTLLPDARWRALVRAFLAGHASHTPLFTEIGREFVRFLQARAEAEADDAPFLPELAHYEWVELAVSIDETEIAAIPHDPDGDVVRGRPLPSPLAWPLAYRWPVHRIRTDYQPTEPPEQPSFLIVARNRRDELSFIETTALSLKLLELANANPSLTGLDCVDAIGAAFPATERDALREAGAAILRDFRQRDIVLGTRID